MSCDLGIIIEITGRLPVKAYLMKFAFLLNQALLIILYTHHIVSKFDVIATVSNI